MLRDVFDKRDPRRFASWVLELRGKSGVYRFASGNQTLYVGSAVGDLYNTLTRHVQEWNRRRGGPSPGHVFDRFNIKAEAEVTHGDNARLAEEIWINEFRPVLNLKAAAELEDGFRRPSKRQSNTSTGLERELDEFLDSVDDFVPF